MSVVKKLPQIDLALNYARKNIEVFPTNKKKIPIHSQGHNAATISKRQIKEWWGKNPNALVAAPNSQYVVIDVDFKNACESLKLLTEITVQRLYERGIVTKNTPKVRTPSGGYHFYFKKSKRLTRRMFILPNIDLLANNGYAILPGQGGYVLENDHTSTPWEVFDNLAHLDINKLESLVKDMEGVTKTASSLKKEFAKKVKAEMYASAKKDTNVVPPMSTMNYEDGTIVFEQTPDMYHPSENLTEKKTFKKDSDGFYVVERIGTEEINNLFHDREVQIRLSEFVGVPYPPIGKTVAFKSVFPNHKDDSPSMGARWSTDGSHIIVRDFVNFYTDRMNQNDYNLVRLYVTCKHKTQAPRLKPPEFSIWFLRMLTESRIINPKIRSYGKDITKLKFSERIVADMFLLLDACKGVHKDYDGQTTFSDRFAAAWCGLPPSTVNRCKANLVGMGYLKTHGFYDCSGNDDENSFYRTPLYSVSVDGNKYKTRLTPNMENTNENS